MHQAMLKDLQQAEHFIFLEYFLIEEGAFCNSILEILKGKVVQGLQVKVVFDNIGIRLEGDAVKELTKLFLVDYGMNSRKAPDVSSRYFPESPPFGEGGYMVPFGDGLSPLYRHRVGKCVIQNMISQAVRYVNIMTLFLIIDNELCQTIENAALQGVIVKIIVS